MKTAGRIGLIVLALLAVAAIALMTWEPLAATPGEAPPGNRHYSAQIVRDEYGVPHIYGRTDADVAYGVAVAHAQDDFFTLQDVAAMSRGRYGAIAGKDGAQVDYLYHLLDARGVAERNWPKVPADTRALFDAYASGLNDYAAAHPGEVKLADLFPLNGQDIAAGFALRQPLFFGLGGVIGHLVAGEPLDPEHGPAIPGAGTRAAPGDAPPIMGRSAGQAEAASPHANTPVALGEEAAMAGSNAFVVAPERSGGETTLISNSHQPWRGGVAWYELVVQSGQGWHYAGATFPGSPYPFLGHNEHLGWTNTVNTPDMVDVYKLTLDASGTRYRLDGKWLPLQHETVTLPVKVGPLVLPIRKDIWRSVHGPVIKNKHGAFAIRYGGMGGLGQLDAYYRLNKAKTYAQWRGILSRLAIPSTNFIYGDEAGNIADVYNAWIPDRPKTLDGRPIDWRGILPGDDSRLIWRRHVPFDKLPQYLNPASGFLFNSNNTPFVAAGPGSDLSPDSVPPRMGVELKMTNRARRAWKLMSAAPLLDRTNLERIKYDTRYENAGYIAHMMADVAKLRPRTAELRQAQALLLAWDGTEDDIGRGDALALLMIKPFMGSSYNNTPWPDAGEELRRSADHLMRVFGRLDPPMSLLLRLRQGPGPYAVDLPLDGGSDTLRASTLWDIDPDGKLNVKHGDSFIQWAEWRPGHRVTSRSIVPYGAATTRPDNPHFTDQATLFIQHRLKPVHFWRDDVMANAHSVMTVSHPRHH